MYKVIIVDDEFYSREGMKKVIPWNKMDCEVVATFQDAASATDYCRKEKVNIVITDIKMPEISGLEMVKNIKEFREDIKFIIITGYDDFKYAKSAVKLNAVDFILKPVDELELMEAVQEAVVRLKKDHIQVDLELERSMLRYLRGEGVLDRESLSQLEAPFDIALFEIQDYREEADRVYVSKIQRVNALFQHYLKAHDESSVILKPHINRIAAITHRLSKISCSTIKDRIKEQTGIGLVASLITKLEWSELPKGYILAKEMLSYSYYVGSEEVITDKNPSTVKFSTSKAEEYLSSFKIIFSARDKKKINTLLESFFKYLILCEADKSYVEAVIGEMFIYIRNIMLAENIILEELGDLRLIVKGLDLRSTAQKTIDFVVNTMDMLKEKKLMQEDSGIERAIAYIKENYSKSIALKDVSKEVYLNESYLSRKLKSTLGIGFSEYVTKLRMEKAIELLRTGHMVNQVAELVGYSDYRHFSTSFKKYTGYSPKDFKKGYSIGE